MQEPHGPRKDAKLRAGYSPEIQGLRGLAVLLVVAYHAGLPIYGGFVGVDVFFVVSGFVITTMLQREIKKTGSLDFRLFLWRRAKRLGPALSFVVFFTAVASLLILSPLGSVQTATATGIGALVASANIVIPILSGGYFDPAAETNPLLHTWSLSVEEQFYLVLPAVLLISWKLGGRLFGAAHAQRWTVVALVVISFSAAVYGSFGGTLFGSDAIVGFLSPLTRAWEFGIGVLLALFRTSIERRNLGTRFAAPAGALGFLVLASAVVLISSTTAFPGMYTLLPVVGAAFLIFASWDESVFTSRILRASGLQKVGDFSYSLYLWHWPLIVFAIYIWPESTLAPVWAALLAVVPGVLSYHYIEQPIRNQRVLNFRQIMTLVSWMTLAPVATLITVGFLADKIVGPAYEVGSLPVVNYGDVGQDEIHSYIDENFFPCSPAELRNQAPVYAGIVRCHQSAITQPVDVAIIGDSHAEHLFIGLSEVAPRVNVGYYIIDGLPVGSSSEDFDRILDYLIEDPGVRVIILTAFWSSRGVPEEGLLETLRRLEASGKKIFITDDVPAFPFEAIQCRNRISLILPEPRCSISARSAWAVHENFNNALWRVSSFMSSVEILESYKYLCSSKSCSMALEDVLLYRDNNHLNINGSRYVGQRLVEDNPSLSEALLVKIP